MRVTAKCSPEVCLRVPIFLLRLPCSRPDATAQQFFDRLHRAGEEAALRVQAVRNAMHKAMLDATAPHRHATAALPSAPGAPHIGLALYEAGRYSAFAKRVAEQATLERIRADANRVHVSAGSAKLLEAARVRVSGGRGARVPTTVKFSSLVHTLLIIPPL
jgi:hypothetical protein